MGQDPQIYVNKKQLKDLFFTAESINNNIKGRWWWFKQTFHLTEIDYPIGKSYYTPKEILCAIAGKEVKEEFVRIIKDLVDKDCIIQGDYSDFPIEKSEDDYIDLRGIFYTMWYEKFQARETSRSEAPRALSADKEKEIKNE